MKQESESGDRKVKKDIEAEEHSGQQLKKVWARTVVLFQVIIIVGSCQVVQHLTKHVANRYSLIN